MTTILNLTRRTGDLLLSALVPAGTARAGDCVVYEYPSNGMWCQQRCCRTLGGGEVCDPPVCAGP